MGISTYIKHTDDSAQGSPSPGTVQNSGGAYVFQVDDWGRLERFLVLGSEGGSYYATERELTLDNVGAVKRCLAADPAKFIDTIVELSFSGRAPKNDPAIFALAMASVGHIDLVRQKDAINKICRTGTHLFQYCEAVSKMRGWGTGLRSAVSSWYTSKSADELAYQAIKYQSRNGMTHARVLRRANPKMPGLAHDAVARWAIKGVGELGARVVKRDYSKRGGPDTVKEYPSVAEHLPRLISAFEEAKTADLKGILRLISEDKLPREAIPTEHLNSPEVWDAMLRNSMPLTAMIRNLAKMTTIGLISTMSDGTRFVVNKLRDTDYIHKSRLHPIALLIAWKTYSGGRGMKGSLTWNPEPAVVDALESAFYASFKNVVPSDARTMIGLDVSGSMDGGNVAGSWMTPREASMAMALVTIKSEPWTSTVAFCGNLTQLDIQGGWSLRQAIERVNRLSFGSTDCSLPIEYARSGKIPVDHFVIYTDSETNSYSSVKPHIALKNYRQSMGIGAKLTVVGMVSNGFTIADPNDPGMLDVVGFDASAPAVISNFARPGK